MKVSSQRSINREKFGKYWEVMLGNRPVRQRLPADITTMSINFPKIRVSVPLYIDIYIKALVHYISNNICITWSELLVVRNELVTRLQNFEARYDGTDASSCSSQEKLTYTPNLRYIIVPSSCTAANRDSTWQSTSKTFRSSLCKFV